MRKWMRYAVVVGLTAGTASAGWWPFGSDKKDEQAPVTPAPVAAREMPRVQSREGVSEEQHRKRPFAQMEKIRGHREQLRQRERDRRYQQITPEQVEKMKAARQEIMKLGEAARNETDPAKKEVLVGQLRAKLTDVADKIQSEGERRLEQAEQELPKLKEKLAEAEKNKATRIEEQVQRILSGEPLRDPERKFKEPSGQ